MQIAKKEEIASVEKQTARSRPLNSNLYDSLRNALAALFRRCYKNESCFISVCKSWFFTFHLSILRREFFYNGETRNP